MADFHEYGDANFDIESEHQTSLAELRISENEPAQDLDMRIPDPLTVIEPPSSVIGASRREAGRTLQMAPNVGPEVNFPKFLDCQNLGQGVNQVDILLDRRVMNKKFISCRKRLNWLLH